jgi:hypothetical protein
MQQELQRTRRNSGGQGGTPADKEELRRRLENFRED